MAQSKTCSAEGCDRPSLARGMCGRHWHKWRATQGNLPTSEERFWAKVDKSGECWIWTGKLNNGAGYGRASVNGDLDMVHRHAYRLLMGPILKGLVIDHLCRNRACVNPVHLEAVTHRTNLMRGYTMNSMNSAKTTCKRGHEFTPENTYVYRGLRSCRQCCNARQKAFYARKHQGAA